MGVGGMIGGRRWDRGVDRWSAPEGSSLRGSFRQLESGEA